jgi:hypothetical protein
MTTYRKTSPYFNTPVVNGYLDLLEYRTIPALVSDVRHQIGEQHQYRPDLLSYDLYGTPDLWWVFAVRNVNVIKDPIFDFRAGTTIYLPNIDTINQALGI